MVTQGLTKVRVSDAERNWRVVCRINQTDTGRQYQKRIKAGGWDIECGVLLVAGSVKFRTVTNSGLDIMNFSVCYCYGKDEHSP